MALEQYQGEYKGMNLIILPQDNEYKGYFESAAKHKLSLQKCGECGLIRYPITCACPFCTSLEYSWQGVSGKGTIYSYEVVEQAINPGFREWAPYVIALVELDEQRGKPTPDDGVRLITNIIKADGAPEDQKKVGIGARVEVTFTDVDANFALPQFKLSGEPPEGGKLWQFPH